MKSKLLYFFQSILCLATLTLFSVDAITREPQKSWKEINTVAEVYQAFPQEINSLFESLDLSTLTNVRQPLDSGNLVAASTALLEYYQTNENALHLRVRPPEPTNHRVALADTILNYVFTVQNVRGQVPVLEDGHHDWYYKGPNNDREWAWLSNRHSQLNQVLQAYFETGNPEYARFIDLFLKDFIIKSLPYPGVKSRNSIWRGLEVAARAKVWSRIFYGLIGTDYLSPATQMLMLSSLKDHAHYNRNFHGQNNWLTMEISALATIATNFPEFSGAGSWLEYSISVMTESLLEQVYPDGVQTELTSHYHNVALRNFVLFKEICDRAQQPLPDSFSNTIEAMYSYLAHTMRPDGYRILNNDGDRGSDRNIVLDAAKKYRKPDWEYIATNGKSGAKPTQGPSWFYPWAGQLISRDGYQTDAQWSFFDIGPWGSGHQHNDKMHLSITAYGRDLLVDAGRFAYTGAVADKFRGYARSTGGHNTLLIDGKGQKPDIKVREHPLSDYHFKIDPDFDFAWNSFDQYQDIDGVTHTRSMLYTRGEFWVVVDKVSTEKARDIEALWHWHPGCLVQLEKKSVITSNNKQGNLQIIPVGKTSWDIAMITGQEEPEIQGWYSPEYNKFEPSLATVYSTRIESEETFIWLLVPFNTRAPKLKIKKHVIENEGVSLRIRDSDKGEWELFIPFSNSELARVTFTKLN